MTKRENILVIVGGLALVVGAAYYGMKGISPISLPVVQQAMNAQKAQAISAQLTKTVQEKDLTPVEAVILQAAAKAWTNDPFYRWDKSVAGASQPGTAPTFVFSGFLEMGERRLAIINGMEYQVGEDVAEGGYVVSSIGPKDVTLTHKSDGVATKVPYSGE